MNGNTEKQSQAARWMLLPLAALIWPAAVPAAEYPGRPLRLVVSFPPGGAADFQARILGMKLTQQMRQQVVIDNRPGGSGVVALETVAKSAADGHTLLLGPMSALTLSPSIFPKLPYDPIKDFAPISMTSRVTNTLAASPSLPANSIRDLIAPAKASPGKISYGSTGMGSVTHLAGEMLKSLAGIDLVHVPYKGAGPQLIDVMSGNVAMGFMSLTGAIPHVRSGKLQALVVTSKQRSTAASDVPTVAEVGMPDIEICSGWFGILAPAQTPKSVVFRLNREIVGAILRAARSPQSTRAPRLRFKLPAGGARLPAIQARRVGTRSLRRAAPRHSEPPDRLTRRCSTAPWRQTSVYPRQVVNEARSLDRIFAERRSLACRSTFLLHESFNSRDACTRNAPSRLLLARHFVPAPCLNVVRALIASQCAEFFEPGFVVRVRLELCNAYRCSGRLSRFFVHFLGRRGGCPSTPDKPDHHRDDCAPNSAPGAILYLHFGFGFH
jgi:tripartite-type tricarboxylate transporter receptor subunit TctC